MPESFHDSRPSGVLSAKPAGGFNIGKFLGLTVALAAGAGAGVGGYALWSARANAPESPEPVEKPADVGSSKEDLPPARKDVPPAEPPPAEHNDGKLRLDLPDHPSNRGGGGGGRGVDPSGPDVEVPDWQ